MWSTDVDLKVHLLLMLCEHKWPTSDLRSLGNSRKLRRTFNSRRTFLVFCRSASSGQRSGSTNKLPSEMGVGAGTVRGFDLF